MENLTPKEVRRILEGRKGEDGEEPEDLGETDTDTNERSCFGVFIGSREQRNRKVEVSAM